jgi:calcineurin-like phosphoesterase family protein
VLLGVALLSVASAGASGATSPVRYPVIAAAGDIACDPSDSSFDEGLGTGSECTQRATSDLLLQGRYAAVLTLGDNQYEDGGYAAYVAGYASSWGRVKSLTRPAPGNHEYHESDAAGYFRYFGRAAGPIGRGYYSFNLGKWHLVSLNSNCTEAGGCDEGSAQVKWLRRDLAAHRATCTLAYWHHPRFSSGRHGSNRSVAPLWKVLYEWRADVVLVGHDHDYERFAPLNPAGGIDAKRGIREFVVGTGGKSHYAFESTLIGSQVRDATSFGILALKLKPKGYEWRFVPATGSFSDHGSARCR